MTDWLAQHLNDPDLRIVDMRSEEAYRKAHIPGVLGRGTARRHEALERGHRRCATPAEYSGFDVRAKRGGCIPGTVNIDWVRNVTKDDLKTFNPAADLHKIYTRCMKQRG